MLKFYKTTLQVLCCCYCSISLLIAQNATDVTRFAANTVTFKAEQLDSAFLEYEVYQFDATTLATFLHQNEGAKNVRLQFGTAHDWDLVLRPNEIRTVDYRLLVGDNNGVQTFGRDACPTFSGHFDGDADTRNVRLTIAKDFIFGYIKNLDGEQFYIETLRRFVPNAAQDYFVVYNSRKVRPHSGIACGVKDVAKTHDHDNNLPSVNASLLGVCKQVALATAADKLMVDRYGSVEDVKNFALGVTNSMQAAYYATPFNDEIHFTVNVQYISTALSSDPFTPVDNAILDAGVLLADFRTWGNANGFGSTSFDLAQVWTTRDISYNGSSNVIGLAYIGVVCGSYRYQILEDFGGGVDQLMAHETGHNFNCQHDATGTYVMSPSNSAGVAPWSVASISTVNSYYPTATCITNCTTLGTPATDFTTSRISCVNVPVPFKDVSTNEPTIWAWTFTGGAPSSAAISSPSVVYNTAGIYNVSLQANNTAGAGTTRTRSSYLYIKAQPTAACMPSSTASLSSTYGMTNFNLANVNSATGFPSTDGNAYLDFSCTKIAYLTAGSTYTPRLTIGSSVSGTNYFTSYRIYIDYNNNGVFTDMNELVATSSGYGYIGTVPYTGSPTTTTFTVPASPTFSNTVLRMRVIAGTGFATEPSCTVLTQGQIEDYGVIFNAVLPVEWLSFSGQKKGDAVHLNWSTASEKNNAGFDIERSQDGQTFEKIGFVKGNGTTARQQDYFFSDEKLPTAQNTLYYRLQQTDFDGVRMPSNIVAIEILSGKKSLKVYPNPSDGNQISVELPEQNAQIEAYNSIGQLMLRQPNDAAQTLRLDISTWARGVYIIKTNNATSEQVKFVKN